MKKERRIYSAILLPVILVCFIFLSAGIVTAEDQLPDLVPLPAPEPEPSHLNDPPETYPGQVIIKYTQNYKQNLQEGQNYADESVLTSTVMGTLYPLYDSAYAGDRFFTGEYRFKEGQMSWSYNAKNYDEDGLCVYLTHSVGSGNIDISYSDKVGTIDNPLWLESVDTGTYTMDVNNYGRFYLTAQGLPTEDINLAMKPLQITTSLISGGLGCSSSGSITNDVPPAVHIRLENLKADGNILSGDEVLRHTDDPWNTYTTTEMISYTIELPPTEQDKNGLEEPINELLDNSQSNEEPEAPNIFQKLWNWVKNLFH